MRWPTERADSRQITALDQPHGASVTLKFLASDRMGTAVFTNHGFDTGSLIDTNAGWRILHYSSFKAFSVQP